MRLPMTRTQKFPILPALGSSQINNKNWGENPKKMYWFLKGTQRWAPNSLKLLNTQVAEAK